MDNLKTKTLALLRWSQKYTKTDMVYLARGGFWIFLAQTFGGIAAFAVTVALTNTLPKEVFGEYRFIVSIIPILGVFTLPGIGAALTRAVARGESVNLKILVKKKIKWGFLGTACGLLLALYYYIQGNTVLASAFSITAILIPFLRTFFIYSFYYRGLHDFKTPSIYQIVSRTIQALVMIVTVLATHSVLALVAAFLLGQIITRLFFYIKTIRTIEQGAQKHETQTKDDLTEYGKKLSVIQVVTTFINQLDKMLVWHFGGAATLATYVVALAIPTAGAQALSFIPQTALPKFSARDWSDKNEKYILLKKVAYFTLALVAAAMLYTLCAPVLIHLFFPGYNTAILLAMLAAPMLVLAPIRNLLEQVFISDKRVWEMSTLKIWEFVTHLLLFLFLSVEFGVVTGAVLSFVLKLALTILLQFILLYTWRR